MIKEQRFSSQEEALKHFTEALTLANNTAAQRNAEDPDLNEIVTSATELANKRYYLTRPDPMEGVVTIIFAW